MGTVENILAIAKGPFMGWQNLTFGIIIFFLIKALVIGIIIDFVVFLLFRKVLQTKVLLYNMIYIFFELDSVWQVAISAGSY